MLVKKKLNIPKTLIMYLIFKPARLRILVHKLIINITKQHFT